MALHEGNATLAIMMILRRQETFVWKSKDEIMTLETRRGAVLENGKNSHRSDNDILKVMKNENDQTLL